MKSYLFLLFPFMAQSAHANNIKVENVQIHSQNTANDTYQIQFDLSWENSWHTSTLESNWDAAWVFIKFSKLNQNVWGHATLNTAGTVAPSGSIVQLVDDVPGTGVGAFVYRNADGVGNVSFSGVQLQWNYGVAGLDDNDLVEVSVQAIEMVYIPQGAFYLGDGNGGGYAGFEDGVSGQPFEVTSDNTLLTLGGGSSGSLGNNNRNGQIAGGADDFHDTQPESLPVAFPLGYEAFYMMKYEISQGQYTGFLNLLTQVQQSALYTSLPCPGTNTPCDINNNTVYLNGSRYEAARAEWPCNFVRWSYVAAYLDWSGLRPLSETEYEKTCRGTLLAVPGEFAWGNSTIHAQAYTVVNDVTPNATISDIAVALGNCANNQTIAGNGPLRCGIFAASSLNGTREEAGASYYGVMELTGNLHEYYVTVGRPTDRMFTAEHGDGTITTAGLNDVRTATMRIVRAH